MTFSEVYLRGSITEAEIKDRPRWGHHEVCVDFAGGGYLFHGLSAGQKDSIQSCFKGFCIPEPAESAVAVDCSVLRCDHRLFKFSPEPGWEYDFDRKYSDESIMLGGHRFVGVIRWRPDVSGIICTSDPGDPNFVVIFENFFRVLAAYRLLALGGMILHSACVARAGKAYLFIGHSGAGKTTISTIAQDSGWEVLSDDLNATRFDDGRWYVEKLPFAGDLGRTPSRGQTYPLAGLFELRQGPENRVSELSKARAMATALACSPVINDDGPRMDELFRVLSSLVTVVPTMALEFSKSGDALSRVEEAVSRTR